MLRRRSSCSAVESTVGVAGTSVAEVTGNRGEDEVTGRYRYTRVYVRNAQGQWKIVSFESSRIREAGERK